MRYKTKHTMVKDLIIHPDVQALQKELEQLRQKSSELYLQAEFMQFEERPLLYSLYETQIGKLEYEEFQQKIKLKLLTYEAKLIQSYINRNERPDTERIAEQIRMAQAAYKTELEQKEADIRAAHAFLISPAMSLEESTELRDLYRMIAKSLHPDLHPDADQKEKDLFVKAVSAYRVGDIHVLCQIALALSDEPVEDIPDMNLPHLIDQARKTVEEFENRIARMNGEFPFIYRKQLADKEWVKQQHAELTERIKQVKAQVEEANNYLMMLKLWKPESLS